MEVDIRRIAENLCNYSPELIVKNDSITSVKAVKLFARSQKYFRPDILYAGRLSEFPQNLPTDGGGNFLCIPDVHFARNSFLNHNINLIITRNKCDLGEVVNVIQDVFLAEQKISEKSSLFLDAIIHGRGLQHIIDLGFHTLNNPIALFDKDINLIVRSKDVEIKIDDPFLTAIGEKGCFSEETMHLIKELGIRSTVLSNRRPFIFKTDRLKYNRVFCNVYINGVLAATVVMLECLKPVDEEDLAILSQLCDVVSSEMQKRGIDNLKTISYETFLSDVLESKLTDSADIELRARNLGWRSSKYNYLLVVKKDFSENVSLNISVYREALCQAVENCMSAIYGNQILIFIGRDAHRFKITEDMKALEAYLEVNKLFAALSCSFSSIANLGPIYKNTLETLEMGMRLDVRRNIFSCDEYQVLLMIEKLSKYENPISFCNPVVFELIEYDRINRTEYAQTLYTYLSSFKNSLKTSKLLHTHQNTIFYRLEKINALFDIDFSDESSLFQILFSFKIIELTDNLRFSPAF